MFTPYYPKSLDDLIRIINIRVPNDYNSATRLCSHMLDIQDRLDSLGFISIALVRHIVRLRCAFNIHIQLDAVFSVSHNAVYSVSHKSVFTVFIYRLNALQQDPKNYCTPAFYAQYLLEV